MQRYLSQSILHLVELVKITKLQRELRCKALRTTLKLFLNAKANMRSCTAFA
jgi:hypothetical protein